MYIFLSISLIQFLYLIINRDYKLYLIILVRYVWKGAGMILVIKSPEGLQFFVEISVILLNMNWKCANFYNESPNRLEIIDKFSYCPCVRGSTNIIVNFCLK